MASGTPLAIALVLLIGVSCGADADRAESAIEIGTESTDDAEATSSVPSTAESDSPPSVDDVESDDATPDALAWSADLVGGGRIDMAERGSRPVLLWFWAPY